MPKKFLIYVHDNDKFEKETPKRGDKSQLVNTLLDAHWKETDRPKRPRTQGFDPVLAGADVTKTIIKTPEDAKAAVNNSNLCPHGFAKGLCKKSACNKKEAQENQAS